MITHDRTRLTDLSAVWASFANRTLPSGARRAPCEAIDPGARPAAGPIHWRSPDEFGRLAETLDSMRSRLVSSYREIQQQNERLREVDELKSSFLAMVSHEMRTPMNGIMGTTHLLLESPLSDSQREMVDVIRTSSRALLTLINDTPDFSKLGVDRLEMVFRGERSLEGVIKFPLSAIVRG